jgi:hypothetical protein
MARGRAPRAAAAALLLLAAAAAAAAAKPRPRALVAAGTTPVQPGPGGAFRATVQPGAQGRLINQVLGVSVEWDRVADYDSSPRWARVFGLLGPAPVIRVGGSSAELLDKARLPFGELAGGQQGGGAWAPQLLPPCQSPASDWGRLGRLPSNEARRWQGPAADALHRACPPPPTPPRRQMPPPATWRALQSLAKATGARYIINLKASGGDADFTVGLFQRAIQELGPSIQGFELGNEVGGRGRRARGRETASDAGQEFQGRGCSEGSAKPPSLPNHPATRPEKKPQPPASPSTGPRASAATTSPPARSRRAGTRSPLTTPSWRAG